MMARYGGGRPGSSRRVRLVPVRRSGMDHRAVARIVLAMARQMAAEANEVVESVGVDEVVSSGVGVCARNEPGTSDGQAAARDDIAPPWAGAHSGQSARGVALVGRCAAEKFVSASAGSGSAGRCFHQRHDGAHYLALGTSSAGSHTLPDRAGTAKTDEAAAASSTPGGTQ
ncbi:hypothetical protein HMPREF1979_01139 [Actinomyces johnsonii F0542]|uniref:Uncharacterized protein n=1 Tax=Actinomyces johnsonii F0542 TaxID=1321818 RepID=U1S227_9ACTO|nr:hypothetical protein HMPREF1979_01139 [Actinomyces johnsonii F0542]